MMIYRRSKTQGGALLCAILIMLSSALPGEASISLRSDFSTAENQRAPMRYHWEVSNRISPMRRFNMPVGENPYICVVRPLGGKSKDGKKLIDEDTYKWDGEQYVYDWAPLKMQIDTVQKKARIFQLMIDNVPWAFQRGLNIEAEDQVETYGNPWPPNDPEAWATYIQEMLKELVKTYGRETVEQWRFCIGREIGTSGHWRGSMQAFFEHYALTLDAIHSVLPDAKVGTHFLWASSKKSMGPEFVKWCRQNSVHYDFVGVSYYPFFHKKDRVDLDYVYRADFAPIKDIPEWNPEATLEIHEFSLIKSMSKRGNSFDNAPKAHTDTFTIALGKMMYEHDMHHVFRWGAGDNKLGEQTYQEMEGNIYFSSIREGEPESNGNMVNGVFAVDKNQGQYNVVLYNYNADPGETSRETVQIRAVLPTKPLQQINYRMGNYTPAGLKWTDWEPARTKAVGGTDSSSFELSVELPVFTFGKIEIRAPIPDALKAKRVLTKRADGSQVEVELGELKKGQLLCYVRGRRYIIPIHTLSDEDQQFLKKWAQDK